MSNEIRQEAKTSIAQLNQRKARDRLDRDGANSSDALRRRVRAFAAERSLPPADIAKLMYKRISTRDVMLFCEKHKVSYDWLLCGDLRGLQRMTQEAKATPREMPEAQRKEITRLFLALSPRMQAVALGCIRNCRRGGTYEAPTPNSQEAKPSAVDVSRKAAKAIDDEAARFTPGRLLRKEAHELLTMMYEAVRGAWRQTTQPKNRAPSHDSGFVRRQIGRSTRPIWKARCSNAECFSK